MFSSVKLRMALLEAYRVAEGGISAKSTVPDGCLDAQLGL
jgi:hypothetical protein